MTRRNHQLVNHDKIHGPIDHHSNHSIILNRLKKVKPGLKLQERDRVVLQETVARSKWVHERPPLWPRNPPS